MAVTARLPGWVALFRCPAGLLGFANLLVGSVRIPGSLLLLGCPYGWLGSTNLIVGSIRLPHWRECPVWTAACHVYADLLVASVPLSAAGSLGK